jgi:hypothetical protein
VARAVQPAERVSRLVRDYGSDDKLVEAINAKLGTRLTRQMVIRWRTGAMGISRVWADRLAAFTGGDPTDFRPTTKGSLTGRVDALERRVSRIERQLQLDG